MFRREGSVTVLGTSGWRLAGAHPETLPATACRGVSIPRSPFGGWPVIPGPIGLTGTSG